MIRPRFEVSVAIAAACGIAVSSGMVVGLPFASLVPGVVTLQDDRRRAYSVALAYYAGAAWSVMPVCRNYFTSGIGIAVGILFWALASCLLALPWLWAWPTRPQAALWRTPVAMLLSVVPPLGIIGWAHPLVAAGIFFPGTRWFGLAATLILPGLLVTWPRRSAVAALAGIVFTNLCFRSPAAPPGWQSVNTAYGDIGASLTAQYSASLHLLEHVRAATAEVIVFPESSVPRWSSATAQALRESLAHSKAQVVLLGAQLQAPLRDDNTRSINDVDQALFILGDKGAEGRASSRPSREPYRNVLMAVTAESVQVFDQHVPVPIAMWRPLGQGGVPVHWWRNRPLDVARQRVGVLICYEALLCWPILSAMIDSPNVRVLIANDHWSRNSRNPSFQLGTMWSWSRLFQTPFLRAANR